MNSQLRQIVFWLLIVLLAVYIAGTIHLAYPILAGRASIQGVPRSSVIGGFYIRFLLMAFLVYCLIRLRGGPTPRS